MEQAPELVLMSCHMFVVEKSLMIINTFSWRQKSFGEFPEVLAAAADHTQLKGRQSISSSEQLISTTPFYIAPVHETFFHKMHETELILKKIKYCWKYGDKIGYNLRKAVL